MTTVKIFKHHLRVPFLILMTIESGIFFASNYLGLFLRYGRLSSEPIENLAAKSAVVALVLLLGMVAMGMYQAQRPASRVLLANISFRVAVGLLIGTLGLMVLYYVFPALLIGRGVLALSLFCSWVVITLLRWFFYSTVDSGVMRRRILVYGAGDPAAGLLAQGDRENPLMPPNGSYLIEGFVPVNNEPVVVPESYCVNPAEGLLAFCRARDVDEIVVAVKDRRKNLPTNALLDCKLSGVDVIDFISFHEREQGMLHLDILQPSWMIFSEGYETGNIRHLVSRAFDIGASLAILVSTAPILLFTAIAIYVESGFKGPLLYRQKRVGFNNEVFELVKFRSMRVDAEKDGKAVWASKNDVRITKVGAFIRKTRIDEIPQVFNVLKGDMSIVGPRPERPEFVEQLEKSIPYYRLRHRVKPGLAGWAQIKYPYGANERDAYNKLQFDLFYIKNRTFFMDLLVLLQTIEVVVLGKGAR
ncbi:TIGR03013 family XrtA/PEP-CTERM system glycosyltransferase [Gilvimarinus sp. F26214L]|uniref:TIGR03013 family XrtA/PEP-CTERM system glycosyltransferase n=1 Tax=Gilvimarinus sp. DZF01 TaxID=3461371 RepID=UPI004045A703